MIENRFGNKINYITKPIRQQLPKSNIIPQNYLYIGSSYNINPLDAKALLDLDPKVINTPRIGRTPLLEVTQLQRTGLNMRLIRITLRKTTE